MNTPDLIAAVSALEGSSFFSQTPPDEHTWRQEANSEVLESTVASWQQVIKEKAVDALVHGQFRRASFFFDEYTPSANDQALRLKRIAAEEGGIGNGGALRILWSLAQGTHPNAWISGTEGVK